MNASRGHRRAGVSGFALNTVGNAACGVRSHCSSGIACAERSCADPLDHPSGWNRLTPGTLSESQQAHAVQCMSPSTVNDDPHPVDMGAAPKRMIVLTVRSKPDRSGTQLVAGTGCDCIGHVMTRVNIYGNIGGFVLVAQVHQHCYTYQLFQLSFNQVSVFEMSFTLCPKNRCLTVVSGGGAPPPCPSMSHPYGCNPGCLLTDSCQSLYR